MSNNFTLGALPPRRAAPDENKDVSNSIPGSILFLCVIFSKEKQQKKNGALEEDEKDEDEAATSTTRNLPNSIGIREEALYLQPARLIA